MKSNLESLKQKDVIDIIRSDFPILSRKINSRTLVYLDNAASLQKPSSVLNKLQTFYSEHYANVHRSVHQLSQEATEAYESVRAQVAQFLGKQKTNEVIFTGGTTHSINLVAHGFSHQVQAGDSILVTRLEHHANFIPWQQLAKNKSADFQIVNLDSNFGLDLGDLKYKLQKKPKIFSFSALSNVLGSKMPVSKIAALAKEAGAIVVLDAAQSLCHFDWAADDLKDVDFIAFSSHKLGGPTGVGVLWGREYLLDQMQPMEFGGDMILDVEDLDSKWNTLPWKFEAGTPNFADVVGMGEALRYLEALDKDLMLEHERRLTEKCLAALMGLKGVKVFGSLEGEGRAPIFSFTCEGLHPHDLGTFLDTKAIAVRAGHHCSQPLHKAFGVPATTRASFAFYNRLDEVDLLIDCIKEAQDFFRRKK